MATYLDLTGISSVIIRIADASDLDPEKTEFEVSPTKYARVVRGLDASANGHGCTLQTFILEYHNINNSIEIKGSCGEKGLISYQQKSSTEFIKIFNGGKGGTSHYQTNTGGIGNFKVFDINTMTYSDESNAKTGIRPGG